MGRKSKGSRKTKKKTIHAARHGILFEKRIRTRCRIDISHNTLRSCIFTYLAHLLHTRRRWWRGLSGRGASSFNSPGRFLILGLIPWFFYRPFLDVRLTFVWLKAEEIYSCDWQGSLFNWLRRDCSGPLTLHLCGWKRKRFIAVIDRTLSCIDEGETALVH